MQIPSHRLSRVLLGALLTSVAAADNITGQVVDGGNAPVPGVNISVFDQMTGDEITVSNGGTDSSGSFDADIPGPGLYRVVFVPPAPPTTTLFLTVVENVVVVGTEDMGVITLPDGVALSGRVLRPGGQPYSGLDLDLVDTSTGIAWDIPGDNTDTFGDFLIPAPLGTSELQFEPNPNDVPLVAPDAVLLDLAADTDIGTVQLELGFLVELDVQKQAGGPVVGADLDVIDLATGDERHTPADNTDSTGFVDFVVPAGTYDLEICPKIADKLVTKILASVPVSSTTDLGTTTLESGWLLSGTVTNTQGNPVQGVDIDAIDENTQLTVPLCGEKTNSAGVYNTILPSGTYEIEFEPKLGDPYDSVSVPNVAVFSDTILDAVLGACGSIYCDTNPDNVADIAIDTCACSAGSVNVSMSNAPASQFAYLLVGAGSSSVTDPPGAQGDLCLIGSTIGRYNSDAGATDGAGGFSTDVLNATSGGGGGNIPTIGGNLCAPAGQTWNFQFWHRNGMNPSRFSKAITVTFQ